jgi:hypothetical protein
MGGFPHFTTGALSAILIEWLGEVRLVSNLRDSGLGILSCGPKLSITHIENLILTRVAQRKRQTT